MESLSIISPTKTTKLTNLNAYDQSKTFTFYSERTELLQSNNIYHLDQKDSLGNLTKENPFWLDINLPTKSDLKTISELFNIHPLTIEDILNDEGREKTERFENYIFISIKTIREKMNENLFFNKVSLLLFPNHIITIHNNSVRYVKQVIRRIDPIKNVFQVTSDWFMYALLDDVVDEFVPSIKYMESEVDQIDETILYLKTTNQTEMLRKIGYTRNRVQQLTRLLRPKIEIINVLIKRHTQQFQEHTPQSQEHAPKIQEHTLLYLRDTQDHLTGMIQILEQNSETLNRSHNNYLAQISIELAEMSNRTNIQVKYLTQVTTLAVPFTIISGIWGMNLTVPFEIVNGAMATWEMLLPFASLVTLSIFLSIGFWFLGKQMKFF